MELPVSVKFSYTPDDSLRVAKFIRNQSFLYRNDVVLTSGIVFVAFIILIVLMADDVSALRILGATVFSSIPAIAVGIMVFVMHRVLNPWLMRRTIAKAFNSAPTAGIETQFTFLDDGFKAESELASSFTKWPSIIKVHETDTDLLFYYGHNVLWFLPKSAFNSINDLDSVRILLRRSLKENAILF